MRRILLLLATVLGSTSLGSAATVAAWDFESPNVPPTVTGTTITGLLPDVGSGIASGVHADAATTFSSAVGNGSANALRADHWAIGDYWQFHVSTVGFAHVQLSFDMICSLGGSISNFTLAYSLDGSSFTTYNSNVGVPWGTWNATTGNSACTITFNLTSRTELDGAPDVYFRLVDNLPAVSPLNTQSVDNFIVSATLIPEPSNVALAGLGAAVLVILRRRK